MKKILLIGAALAFLGFGCAPKAPYLGQTYTNDVYGFAFDYPKEFEIHRPIEEHRTFDYLGLSVDYFGAVRDLSRSEKPDTIIAMYADETLSIDDFVKALEASNEKVKVTSTKRDRIGKIEVTTIASTNEADIEKHHYLFDVDGKTIIFSEYLNEQERTLPIVQTLRRIP